MNIVTWLNVVKKKGKYNILCRNCPMYNSMGWKRVSWKGFPACSIIHTPIPNFEYVSMTSSDQDKRKIFIGCLHLVLHKDFSPKFDGIIYLKCFHICKLWLPEVNDVKTNRQVSKKMGVSPWRQKISYTIELPKNITYNRRVCRVKCHCWIVFGIKIWEYMYHILKFPMKRQRQWRYQVDIIDIHSLNLQMIQIFHFQDNPYVFVRYDTCIWCTWRQWLRKMHRSDQPEFSPEVFHFYVKHSMYLDTLVYSKALPIRVFTIFLYMKIYANRLHF